MLTGGAREAAIHGAMGTEVGGGGVADDLGDGVVAAVAAGGGAAGGLVVRVWPEGSGGGGESVAVMWTLGMAAEWEGRREERQRMSFSMRRISVAAARRARRVGSGQRAVMKVPKAG